jgi:hypothetical protein
VRLDKPEFVGRAALLAQRGRVARRLLLLALDDADAVAWGDEPSYRDGRLVGPLTSAAHSHTLGRGVGMGYVECVPAAPPAALLPGGTRSTLPAWACRPPRRCGPGTVPPARGCAPEERP